MKSTWRSVAVQHLYFTYSDERQRVHHLEDVAITLEKGKAIALVGESGCGKSTLLNLLRGMQQPDRVKLFCDGAEHPHQLRHLAEITTLLPQDPEIFADTIRFNITFGLDATEQQIDVAIRMARFDPVLARLPDGLETNIAEKGVNLSGGEKQRLALARGIFFAKDSDILLLDEPTSSVDQQNERLIYSEILHRFKEKCIVSSVHKLNLLDLFDEIYVFSDGRVIERGSLNELLMKGGYLAELQAGASGRDETLEAELPN
jgi:ATP-binding cassette subfamily B protein